MRLEEAIRKELQNAIYYIIIRDLLSVHMIRKSLDMPFEKLHYKYILASIYVLTYVSSLAHLEA